MALASRQVALDLQLVIDPYMQFAGTRHPSDTHDETKRPGTVDLEHRRVAQGLVVGAVQVLRNFRIVGDHTAVVNHKLRQRRTHPIGGWQNHDVGEAHGLDPGRLGRQADVAEDFRTGLDDDRCERP